MHMRRTTLPSSLPPNITICKLLLECVQPLLNPPGSPVFLGRLITRTDSASLALIRPRLLTKIFVAGDVICFFVQSAGAGMLVKAKDEDGVQLGENIVLGGLVLQIVVFMVFVVVAGTWHRRLQAYQMSRGATIAGEVPWQRYITLLYTASACITIRNTCRVIEYAMGRVCCSMFSSFVQNYSFADSVLRMGI